MPFLAVLSNPEIIHKHNATQFIFKSIGFESEERILLALGLTSILALLISAIFRAATLYAQNMFTGMRRHSVSLQLLRSYLLQPYAFFLSKPNSEIGRNILSEVEQYVERALVPLTGLISSLFLLIVMSAVLLFIDPLSTVIVGTTLASVYWLIYRVSRPLLKNLGQERLDSNQLRYKIADEALNGIKLVKLFGLESYYLKRFSEPSKVFAKNIAITGVISNSPKFLIETIAIGGLLLIAMMLVARDHTPNTNNLSDVVPLLGLYALAGYRLMPAIQNIYYCFSQLRFAEASVRAIKNELDLLQGHTTQSNNERTFSNLDVEIAFKNVSYCYPNRKQPAISNISFSIPRGSSFGILGASGAGKTTLVDILLGLLEPTSGIVSRNGSCLTNDDNTTRKLSFGYVPQEIVLFDNSIAENIALAQDLSAIDMERLQECCRRAQIHDFITSQLPEGYLTPIGDRGVRLSGGQRQRLGIARALYRDADVLVFDEATSALDVDTEEEVVKSIMSLSDRRTLIIIAHRLSTVRQCDQLITLDSGKISSAGTFAEVMNSNRYLQRMADPLERGNSISNGC